MKPFELVVYPPLTDTEKMSVSLTLSTGLNVWHTPPPGFLERKAKRLTNAELAAEAWCMMSDWQMAMIEKEPTEPFKSRCETLHRFASLPSYDEVPA